MILLLGFYILLLNGNVSIQSLNETADPPKSVAGMWEEGVFRGWRWGVDNAFSPWPYYQRPRARWSFCVNIDRGTKDMKHVIRDVRYKVRFRMGLGWGRLNFCSQAYVHCIYWRRGILTTFLIIWLEKSFCSLQTAWSLERFHNWCMSWIRHVTSEKYGCDPASVSVGGITLAYLSTDSFLFDLILDVRVNTISVMSVRVQY